MYKPRQNNSHQGMYLCQRLSQIDDKFSLAFTFFLMESEEINYTK